MTELERAIVKVIIREYNHDAVDFSQLTRDLMETPEGERVWGVLDEVETNCGKIDLALIHQYLNDKIEHEVRTGKKPSVKPATSDADIDVYDVQYYLYVMDDVVVGLDFPIYLRRLQEAKKKRDNLTALQTAQNDLNGYNDAEVVDRLVTELKTINAGGQDVSFQRDLSEAFEHAQEDSSSEPEMPTGFHAIDQVWGEFWRKELYVFGGDSGHMKTTLSLNMMFEPLKREKRVLWFDREMTKNRLLNYILMILSGVEVWRMRKRRLRDEDFNKMAKAANEIQDWNLRIVDTVTTPAGMNEEAYRFEPDIVVIDNFQNMDFDKGESFWKPLEGARAPKDLALNHDCASLLLTQITRTQEEIRRGKPPTVEQLFGTRGMKHNADAVLLGYWWWKDMASTNQLGKTDEEQAKVESAKHVYDLYFAKMRGEAVGADQLYVDAVHGQFKDLSKKSEH